MAGQDTEIRDMLPINQIRCALDFSAALLSSLLTGAFHGRVLCAGKVKIYTTSSDPYCNVIKQHFDEAGR